MNSQTTSVKTPKTGLAKRMREWMSGRKRPFTVPHICDGLGATGKERAQIRNAIPDFIDRGEIIRVDRSPSTVTLPKTGNACLRANTHRQGQQTTYLYNRNWRKKQRGDKLTRIIKAIYVSASAFTSADIQRIAGVEDKDMGYVSRIIRNLKKDGYLSRVGRRPCIHGRGALNLYNIPDRDKFKIELM
ncbi:MAG: hypothetical protein ABIJ37_03215 [Pseudomonadota bacterium]